MSWMHHHGCMPMPGQWIAQPGWIYWPVYVPVACPPPAATEPEGACDELAVPREIEARGDAKGEALVGGREEVRLTLEYLVEAEAVDTTVTVTARQPEGTISTWTDSGAGAGFHLQERFLAAAPGTKLALEVADARVTARLRWCETICC